MAKSCKTELTRNDKGLYVIADFLNSGSPVEFTFDSNVEVGKKTAIEIKGNVDVDDPYFYLLDSNGDDMVCTINPLESNESIEMYFPYIYYGEKYTYVSHLDKAQEGVEYMARICISGWDKDDKSLDWYYIFMYFDEIPFEGGNEEENPGDDTQAEVIKTIDVTVDFDEAYYYPDYNDEEKYSEIALKSFDAQLQFMSDGTYTLKNIFGTDYSISYSVSNFNPKNVAKVNFIGNIKVDEGYEAYPYFRTPDNKYMTDQVEGEDGEKMSVDYLSGYVDPDYTYVYKCTEEQLAEGYDQYYVYLNVSGYVGDTGSIDMTLVFGYNDTSTSVSNVEINANAPVEYYNLQGVRIADPSNGIFIRRQGNKTSKIAIK